MSQCPASESTHFWPQRNMAWNLDTTPIGLKQFQSISATSTPILTTATLSPCTFLTAPRRCCAHSENSLQWEWGVKSNDYAKTAKIAKCLDSETTTEVWFDMQQMMPKNIRFAKLYSILLLDSFIMDYQYPSIQNQTCQTVQEATTTPNSRSLAAACCAQPLSHCSTASHSELGNIPSV